MFLLNEVFEKFAHVFVPYASCYYAWRDAEVKGLPLRSKTTTDHVAQRWIPVEGGHFQILSNALNILFCSLTFLLFFCNFLKLNENSEL